MRKVEWHLAGMIICDDCGTDTFFRCLLVRPVNDPQGAHVVRPPATVKCQQCGAEFEVEADTPKNDG